MKVFLSWSGSISKEIASIFRHWLPLLNQQFDPYMSEEDIEKGAQWSAELRSELEASRYGVLVLTPENTGSNWLHFEAGALAKSVDDARLAPILFELQPSDIRLPFSMFQTTQYERPEMLRLFLAMNRSAGEEAREESQLEKVFNTFWNEHDDKIQPLLKRLRALRHGVPTKEDVTNQVLQELVVLSRQQSRILSSPTVLFGPELLSVLARLVQDGEGAAVKLSADQQAQALALTGRWGQLERELTDSIQQLQPPDRTRVISRIRWFSGYVDQLASNLSRHRAQPLDSTP
jgi:hypothetical protein